jgi:hypothetical protein
MMKFWNKETQGIGRNSVVALKMLGRITKEAVMAAVAAHRTAVSTRKIGFVMGRTAWKITKPCLELWDGVKQGFSEGQ